MSLQPPCKFGECGGEKLAIPQSAFDSNKKKKNQEGFFPVIMESANAMEFQRSINLYVVPQLLKVRRAPLTSCVAVQRMTFNLCRWCTQGGEAAESRPAVSGVKSAVCCKGHTDTGNQRRVAG